MTSKHIDRRGFLKRSMGAGIGALAFPYIVPGAALGKGGAVAPSERIVMGCIGVGDQGMGNLKNFLRQGGVQVVAVSDVSRDNWGDEKAGWEAAKKTVEAYYAKEKPSGTYNGCAVYTDFRELLDRDDIDAVTICTPDHWHGLTAVAAAKAGKDIYCEKPLANTVAEGRAVCQAVKRYNRVLQTGSHERSRHNARFACELVRNERIGKLHTIRVNMPLDAGRGQVEAQPTMAVPEGLDWDRWLGPAPWRPYTEMGCHFYWRYILDYGGGEMTDRGAHIIDLAQLGNDTDDTGAIEISGRGWRPNDGLFDTFMKYEFEMIYGNGVRLVGTADEPRGVKFEGSEGWVFIHVHGGDLEAEPKSLLTATISPDEIHLGRSLGHHENFLEAVRTRKEPFAPAEVGHRTGSLCHLINIAMLLDRKLKWDPEKEEVINDSEANGLLSRPMRVWG